MSQEAVLDGAADVEDTGSFPEISERVKASIDPKILAGLVQDEPTDDEEEEEAPDDGGVDPRIAQIAENPNLITRVAQRDLPALLTEVLAYVQEGKVSREQAIALGQAAYDKGRTDASQQSVLSTAAQRIDALLEAGDVAAYRAEVARFPGGERGFYQAKAAATPVAQGSAEYYQAQANTQWGRLTQDEQAAFAAHWDYGADEAGIGRLTRDIDQAVQQRGRNLDDSATQELEQRREAISRNRRLPRIDRSEPFPEVTGNISSEDLKTLSVDEFRALIRDPQMAKGLEKVLQGKRS